jgi:hypothetical protein
MPLIQGGVPPSNAKEYSQAMNLDERWTASASISSSSRFRPARSQVGSPRSQAPCMLFAFLNVDSGCSCSPSPGKYTYSTWLPLKLTASRAAGNGSERQ